MKRFGYIVSALLLAVVGVLAVPVRAHATGLEVISRTLLSASPTGELGDDQSYFVSMTPNARFVGFSSIASNLIPGLVYPNDRQFLSDKAVQAFVLDRQTNTFDVISRSGTGQMADGTSYIHAISDDGRFVLFMSGATNLVPGAVPPVNHELLYLRDRQSGTTTLISPVDEYAGVASTRPHSMSGDGSIIVYSGYLYNRLTGITTELPLGGSSPRVSHDGRYVLYPGPSVLHRYDVVTGTVADVVTLGTPIFTFDLSPDGNYVSYLTQDGMSNPTTGIYSTYVKNIQTGQTRLIKTTDKINTDAGSFSFSADNRLLSLCMSIASTPPFSCELWVADLITGEIIKVEAWNQQGFNFQLSADGTQFAFSSKADFGPIGQVGIGTLSIPPADTTAPVVSNMAFNPNPKSVNQTSATLTAQVSDDISGVSSVEYKDPVANTWQPMSLNGSTASVSVSTPAATYPVGIYAFAVRSTDVAGNVSQPVTINLDVYNPNGGYAAGHGFITPSGQTSNSGDNLPAVTGNNVKATLDFTVEYATATSTAPTGSSIFTWGSNCNKPNNQCFSMATNSLDWLVVPDNSATATFQGLATLSQNGSALGSNYPVKVTVTGASNHYLLQIYAVGANPDAAQPVYQASGDLSGGQIVLHK